MEEKKVYMLASKLTDKQREVFTEEFYKLADDRLNDLDTPRPWGCPWNWGPEMKIERQNTIYLMARSHWENYKKEIIKHLDDDERIDAEIESERDQNDNN